MGRGNVQDHHECLDTMRYFRSYINTPLSTIYRVEGNKVWFWMEHSWGTAWLFGDADVRARRDGIEISKLEVLLLCGAKAVEE